MIFMKFLWIKYSDISSLENGSRSKQKNIAGELWDGASPWDKQIDCEVQRDGRTFLSDPQYIFNWRIDGWVQEENIKQGDTWASILSESSA